MLHDGGGASWLPPSLLVSAHIVTCVMSMCACTTKQKPKATTKALSRGEVRGEMRSISLSIVIYIHIALKPLKHFISKPLSSKESSNSEQAYANTPSIHSNMCSGSSWSWRSSSKKHPSLVVVNLKRQLQKTTPPPHVSVAIRRKRLRLRRLRAGAEAMAIVNLKLYLENRCIIAENERLRERATALRRENLALLQNLSKTVAVPDQAAGAGAGAA